MRAALGCLAVAFAGACAGEPAPPDAAAGRYETRVGIVRYYGEDEGVVFAPDTVAAGEPFDVAILTFGGGCESAGATAVEYGDREVQITPYDVTYIPAPDSPEVCAAILLRFEHRATARFDTPGDASIRVIGRRVNAVTDSVIELVFDVVVE